MKYLLLILCCLGLVACDDDKNVKSMNKVSSDRIQVTLISTVRDDLAYYDKRGVYLIKDTKTGQEYIGVSGIGISEIAKHGKNNSIEDER